MADKRRQKQRNGIFQEAGMNQVAVLSFPYSQLVIELQPLFAHLNFSDSVADCFHVTGTSGQQKSGNEGPFFFAEAE